MSYSITIFDAQKPITQAHFDSIAETKRVPIMLMQNKNIPESLDKDLMLVEYTGSHNGEQPELFYELYMMCELPQVGEWFYQDMGWPEKDTAILFDLEKTEIAYSLPIKWVKPVDEKEAEWRKIKEHFSAHSKNSVSLH